MALPVEAHIDEQSPGELAPGSTLLLDADIDTRDARYHDAVLDGGADLVVVVVFLVGVGELGICGSAAAVANAIYNATGVRVRDYPITLDKLLDRLPAVG